MNTTRSLAQLHAGAVVAIVVSQVDMCDLPLNWSMWVYAARSASCTASSASAALRRTSECPSIKRREAIWQDVLQHLSCVLINEKLATFESYGVRVLHAVVLLPR